MALIELAGIARRFQLGDTTVNALANLNLRIEAGERIVTSLDREGVKAGIKATADDKGKAR